LLQTSPFPIPLSEEIGRGGRSKLRTSGSFRRSSPTALQAVEETLSSSGRYHCYLSDLAAT